MFTLSEKWINDNYQQGTVQNTSVGDKVYVRGYDFWDEVMYPHIVTEVEGNTIVSYEDNPQWAVAPLDRGIRERNEWYIKRELK